MTLSLYTADETDISTITDLLQKMQHELNEVPIDPFTVLNTITKDMDIGTQWFLFKRRSEVIGMCYLQPVHNYWSMKNRYYMGGFYLESAYRGKGYFRLCYDLVKKWAIDNDGTQIFCHINKDNKKSLEAFGSIGMNDENYAMMIDYWGED